MAQHTEWKLLSAEKNLNKRGFINAQVLATLFTLINPEPRYSFWLANASFDRLIIFQLKTCNEIFKYAFMLVRHWIGGRSCSKILIVARVGHSVESALIALAAIFF